jgi:hypothetical protein
MAFIYENNSLISFAEYDDVFKRDQRVFDSNEGLSDDRVEELLIRATERILTKLRASAWWSSYYEKRDNSITYNTVADVPALDPNRIIARSNDFVDLCVYTALAEFILPMIADFGEEDNSERNKMGYYQNKSEALFGELISAGDWYDFDDDEIIQSDEKQPGQYNLKRVR